MPRPNAKHTRREARLRSTVPAVYVVARSDYQAISHGFLETAGAALAPDEALVRDRGFPVAQVLAARVPRFVVRGRQNLTARRVAVPAYAGRGRPAPTGPCPAVTGANPSPPRPPTGRKRGRARPVRCGRSSGTA